MPKNKIAISVGDLNGVGIEICIKAHEKVSKLCKPIYCINDNMLSQAEKMLHLKAKKMKLHQVDGAFKIKPSKITKKSGLYSFNSFISAISLCEQKKSDALLTMPINKQSWEKAKVFHKGHTEYLRKHFEQDVIMMLGNKHFFVSLFTDHIPLNEVCSKINSADIKKFLLNFYKDEMKQVGVLGVNPHAGDGGVLGNEDRHILKAINQANKALNKKAFSLPLVPDVAFTEKMRKKYKYFIAMYHDQGLAPLKALGFEQTINVSLGLPIIRASVGHGSAFDIAYKKTSKVSTKSYINAIKYLIKQIETRENKKDN